MSQERSRRVELRWPRSFDPVLDQLLVEAAERYTSLQQHLLDILAARHAALQDGRMHLLWPVSTSAVAASLSDADPALPLDDPGVTAVVNQWF